MDEVVNAVQLALADQDCFDEMLKYSCTNNFVTYSDSTGDYASQVIDGEFWAPDGLGRATTITFNPETGSNNSTIYNLDTAIINDMTYGNGSVAYDRVIEGALTEDNQCYFKNASLNGNATGYTYNRVRQTVGDSVISTSQTYRNSSFTIFIRFTQKDGVTVAEVNGQFNGTNLYEGAPAAKGSGTTEYEPDTGNAIVTVTNPGTQESEYTQSDFGGTGSFGGVSNINNDMKDYQEPTYIENLQKEHKFEYYSSASLASSDITDGTYGKNADCDKADAVAGIYVSEDGTPTLVILKDSTEPQRIRLKRKANVILGGHTLTFGCTPNANVGIDMYDGGTIDGRIAGSSIIMINDTLQVSNVMQLDGDITLNGGVYTSENLLYGGVLLACSINRDTNIIIKNATFCVNHCYSEEKYAENKNHTNVISTKYDTGVGKINGLIENCKIISNAYGPCDTNSGINWFDGTLTIKNSSICICRDVTDSGDCLAVRAQKGAVVELNNCDITSTGYACYAQSDGKITLNKTTTIGKQRLQ